VRLNLWGTAAAAEPGGSVACGTSICNDYQVYT
jgi:hypothetical protein